MRIHSPYLRSVAVLAAALTAGLTACTAPPAERASPAPSSTPTASAGPAWQLDLPVIGQPEAAGDVAVVYAAENGRLSLIGVDAATGEQLWSQPASPGAAPPGIPIGPTMVEDAAGRAFAAYLRPASSAGLRAEVVVADPRTGEDVAATETTLVHSPPGQCDDGHDVCFDGLAFNAKGTTTQRLRLSDGAHVEEPQQPNGFQRGVGPLGLSDVRVDGVEYLSRVEGGKEVWRQSIDHVFGPGYSTDGGWGWDHFEDGDLLIGWVGRSLVGSAAGAQHLDLAAFALTALDAGTGEVVWRDLGSLPGCAATIPLPDRPGADPVAVRCRYSGEMTLGANRDPTFAELDVVVEGFDVRTGATAWALPVGAVGGLVIDGGAAAIAGPEEILLAASTGPVLVNLLTGATRSPQTDEVFGCVSATVSFEYAEPFYIDDVPITERNGGTLLVPCGPDAVPVTGPLPRAVLAAAAVQVGDRYVAASEDGLVGYDVG